MKNKRSSNNTELPGGKPKKSVGFLGDTHIPTNDSLVDDKTPAPDTLSPDLRAQDLSNPASAFDSNLVDSSPERPLLVDRTAVSVDQLKAPLRRHESSHSAKFKS